MAIQFSSSGYGQLFALCCIPNQPLHTIELALCSEFDHEFSRQLCSLICATHSLAPMLSHPCYTYVAFIDRTIGKDHLPRKWNRLTHHQTDMSRNPRLIAAGDKEIRISLRIRSLILTEVAARHQSRRWTHPPHDDPPFRRFLATADTGSLAPPLGSIG